uniref:NADH-ubiquinone oxidoreductase chain 6 n=1 Tax=Xenapatidea procincta TaxID=2803870 RepID=A0A897FZZ1_9HYME|nr:NADH dehydrogenase subunit 6 [Xenapatidea procincta]
MIKILLFNLFSNSIFLYSSKSPLSMGLILLIQTLNISLISGLLSLNFWYSYILFLIMVGGLLILFIYVSSLSPNQKFTFNKKIFLINILFIFMIMWMLMKMDNYFTLNLDMINFNSLEINQNYMLKMSLNKLYNKPTNQIMFLLINYLLLTLFIIVKIININMGPLRKSF